MNNATTQCPDPEKWLKRLQKHTQLDPETGCHIWKSTRDVHGYGMFRYMDDGVKRGTGAHRAMWLATFGDLDTNMQIDHLCRVTACVNPEHLEAVTRHENMRRVPRRESPKRGKGTSRHAIRVPGHLWDSALDEAETRGETVNEAIRRFLRAYSEGRDVEVGVDAA